MCVKSHIYSALSFYRRRLGLSQQDLAAQAGLRREKVNRVESRGEDIGLDDLCRLLDAVGLELAVVEKPASAAGDSVPREFGDASFIQGSRAKIVDWGKLPK